MLAFSLDMLALGDLLFDPAARRVFRGGSERRLSPKATAVLLALAETPRQVWSRSALLERVWPATHVGEEVLTHAIAELRRGLGDDPSAPRFIETVHKSGYRIMQPFVAMDPDAPAAGGDARITLAAYVDYLTACDLYERGGRHIAGAIDLFQSVVREWPSFALAHSGLATALAVNSIFYVDQKERARALEHCDAAHRIAGGSSEAFAAEGLVFALAGDDARSAESFASALTRHPHAAKTHALLGRACLALSEFGRAALVFERAARLQSDDYLSLVCAGWARKAVGDAPGSRTSLTLALSRMEDVLAARPTDANALCYKANCLSEVGRDEEVHAVLDAVANDSDDPRAFNLACMLARTGRHERALDIIEEGVSQLRWPRASLERDSDLDALRGTPRFSRIVATLPYES